MHYNRDTTTKGNKLHTLQWVAVEADDVDTALITAKSELESQMGGDDYATNTWYDWFVAGGGRWNISEDEDWQAGYEDKTNMVIAFEDNPNAFTAKIQQLIAYRIDLYNKYLEEFKGQDILDKLDNYGGVMTYDPAFYALSRLIAFQQGNWDYDSGFYDLVHWSTNATHILSKIDNGLGENLYLVPIDFHF